MLNQSYLKIKSLCNDEFTSAKTNFERCNNLWKIAQVQTVLNDLVNKKIEFDGKNLEKANVYREEGNQLFKKKNFYEAINKYNLCLKYCPTDHENLSLTYANRSAAFFKIGNCRSCIDDIELALKHNYPEKLRIKVYERKIDCHIKLGTIEDAIKYLEEIIKNETNAKNKEILEKRLEAIRDDDLIDLCLKDQIPRLYNCTITKKSPVLLYGSDSLQIDHSTSKGNHLKATKTIEPGDVVINEPPYASVLINKFIITHCYECMKRLDSKKMTISYCTQCTHVAYCSETCRATSFENSHKYECKLFKLLVINVGLTHMEHLALRIVMKAGFKYLKSIKSSLINYENEYYSENYKIKTDEKYDSLDYMNIFRLVTHAKDREASDLFRRAFVAMFLTRFLEKASFFENSENLNEDRSFIGGLILRHMQSISCNAHEINELTLNKSSIQTSHTDGIGAGIYAILSLFNHSCDPHVVRNFNGYNCVVRAIQTINKDEEVYDNYGVVYAICELDERRSKLQDQYFFECQCKACEKDWPLYDSINNDLDCVSVRCDTCKAIMNKNSPTCSCKNNNFEKTKTNLDNSYAQFHSALIKFLDYKENEKHFSNFCVCFINYLKLMDRFILTRPYQGYNSCQEAVKQCFNIMSENKHEI